MLRRINILAYVRRYHWLIAIAILLVAMFALSKPPIPADLNYKYQLDLNLRSYPLVPVTAGLVEWSTERVREVYRWNLTAEIIGHAAPPDKAGTEDAILPATILIFIGVFGTFMIWFVPAKRAVGIGMIIFVFSAAHLGAHPEAYVKFMSAPSIVVPNTAVALVTRADPGRTLGVEPRAQNRLRDMADRYFEHYVTFTEHRMGKAGKVMAGPKRLWFGITGLMYVMPFALSLALLSALTTLTQTLCWVLFMIAPFAIALAVGDGRRGVQVWQHVAVPLFATTSLLAILGLALPLVLYLATLIHASENEVGLLAIGSLFPAALVVTTVLLVRRMKEGHHRGRALDFWSDPHHDRTELLGASRGGLRPHGPRSRRARQRHLRDLRRRF